MVHAGYNDMAAFHAKLARSKRILAVCGAGLSAASGLPTFRGAGGYWRNHQATDLATPGAFERDPGLVWLFYAYVSPVHYSPLWRCWCGVVGLGVMMMMYMGANQVKTETTHGTQGKAECGPLCACGAGGEESEFLVSFAEC